MKVIVVSLYITEIILTLIKVNTSTSLPGTNVPTSLLLNREQPFSQSVIKFSVLWTFRQEQEFLC
jgi:hypothetical protein